MKIDMKKKKRKVDNAFALTEDTFKDSTKLHKSVKRIDLQVRVGNGWVSAGEEPATKKRRAEEKIGDCSPIINLLFCITLLIVYTIIKFILFIVMLLPLKCMFYLY
ncbi:hypothetical protein RhiirA1_460155 [Rhizophagus irregularis]|uniref:Uncharacterized protein n=1 Tax=Rhizophagus irregularis TaxID=588596 RepID=A0A2N0RS23_9GLOM|nr:hypothetical protein RhiirA1_460155 [Rhizophagus irregularis]